MDHREFLQWPIDYVTCLICRCPGWYSSLKMPIGKMMIEFNWYFRTVSVNDKVNDFIEL